mgnify:CR=1 FL=1|jgi:hypothetical protein
MAEREHKSQFRFNLTDDAIERIRDSSYRSGNNLSVTVEQAIRSTYKRNTTANYSKESMNDHTEQ